jgi:LacI family transcriptional regulator
MLEGMKETPRVVLLMIPFAGYDRGLLEGIARYAQLHGPWMFFISGDYPEMPLPTSDSLSGEFVGVEYMSGMLSGMSLPNLRRWGATGVIGRIQSSKMAKRLAASGLPVIGIDFSEQLLARQKLLSGISEILADSHKAGRLAAEHFLERGFWNFAFCGFEGRIWSQHRQQGFVERLQEAGFSCNVYQPSRLKHGLSWKQEMPMVTAWLKSLPKPAAVMACNDIRGRQVLEATLLTGFDVPEDVAVIGVDDDRLTCSLSNPPLSSVAINLNQAGYQAAELLGNLMAGKVRQPQQIVADALWVVGRRSSDVIVTEDRDVAAALRFIRDNARQPIRVGDVVRQTGISRRNLEIRFRQVMGRSIHDEVRRIRLVFTKQLLTETGLPTERIANLAGFCSLPYLMSVFRRETGMTLAEFRRRTRVP